MNYIPPLLLEGPVPGPWAFSEATRAVTGETQLQPARDLAKALSDMRDALWRQERRAPAPAFWRYLVALVALEGTVATTDRALALASGTNEKAYLARTATQDGIATYTHLATECVLVLGRLAARLVLQAQTLVGRLPLGKPAPPDGPSPAALEGFAMLHAVLTQVATTLAAAAALATPDRLPGCALSDSATLRDLAAEYHAYAYEISFYLAVYKMQAEPFGYAARVAQSAALAETFAVLGRSYQRSDHAGIRLRMRAAYWLSQAQRSQMRTLATFNWNDHATVSFQASVDRAIVCRHIAALDASNAAMARCLELIDAHPQAFPDHINHAFFAAQSGQLADLSAFHADLAADANLDATASLVCEGNAAALPTTVLLAPAPADLPDPQSEPCRQFRAQHAAFFALFEAAALGGLSDDALVREAWNDRALLQPPAREPTHAPVPELPGRPWEARIARLLTQLRAHDTSASTFEQGLAAGALMERLAWLEWLLAQPARQHPLDPAELEAQVAAAEDTVGHVRVTQHQ